MSFIVLICYSVGQALVIRIGRQIDRCTARMRKLARAYNIPSAVTSFVNLPRQLVETDLYDPGSWIYMNLTSPEDRQVCNMF